MMSAANHATIPPAGGKMGTGALEQAEDDPDDYLCGFGEWKPKCLQKLATPKSFLTVYGMLGSVQAMAFIYFLSTLTTIEKRFGIQSKTTGWILSGNEVSQIMLSLILSYYGGQRNRPVWIAWGVAFSALSCFILAAPHFIFGSGPAALALTEEYEDQFNQINSSLTGMRSSDELCRRGKKKVAGCLRQVDYSSAPIFIFLSQFVLGIGTTLYYSLGQAYFDDSSQKVNTPMILGRSMSVRMIGTVFSFLLAYLCLSTYINPSLTPTISKTDPRWLGAWWLGWIILGSIMILQAVLIALFPKKLNKMTEFELPLQKEERSSSTGTVTFYVGDKNPLRLPENEFFPSLIRLLQNRILMANILAGCFYILGNSGYMTFMTKIMEVQFYRTTPAANLLIGPIFLLSMVGGFLVSGYMISRYKPAPVYLFSWNIFVGSIFVAGEILYIYLACSDVEIVGFNAQTNSFSLVNECNADCGCEGRKFSPVYIQDRALTFYSACHAGCTSTVKDGVFNVYKNCSCIPVRTIKNVSTTLRRDEYKFESSSELLRNGYHPFDCDRIYTVYLIVGFIKNFLGCTGKIANILVIHRGVKTHDIPFAQGLALFFISLFAFIPGPIIFGYIIDMACLIWDISCGKEGNCWFYNRYNFRLYLNGTAAIFTASGVLMEAVMCYYGRNLQLYDESEDDEEESDDFGC